MSTVTPCGEFVIRCLVQMRAHHLGADEPTRLKATRIALDHWRQGRSGTFGVTAAHGYMRDRIRHAQPEQPAC